jgi:hypothetical protein
MFDIVRAVQCVKDSEMPNSKSSDGRGEVKDPKNDGRLKENKASSGGRGGSGGGSGGRSGSSTLKLR